MVLKLATLAKKCYVVAGDGDYNEKIKKHCPRDKETERRRRNVTSKQKIHSQTNGLTKCRIHIQENPALGTWMHPEAQSRLK